MWMAIMIIVTVEMAFSSDDMLYEKDLTEDSGQKASIASKQCKCTVCYNDIYHFLTMFFLYCLSSSFGMADLLMQARLCFQLFMKKSEMIQEDEN